jgi:hypothetical protein
MVRRMNRIVIPVDDQDLAVAILLVVLLFILAALVLPRLTRSARSR